MAFRVLIGCRFCDFMNSAFGISAQTTLLLAHYLTGCRKVASGKIGGPVSQSDPTASGSDTICPVADVPIGSRAATPGALTMPALAVSLLPKAACPLCSPAYGAVLSVLGLPFIGTTTYLLPVMLILLDRCAWIAGDAGKRPRARTFLAGFRRCRGCGGRAICA